jgi:2-dehydro-3-deoxyphosphogluconate aldolase/(4S)-4-hydroxy-2-oxoglutarate aldolase
VLGTSYLPAIKPLFPGLKFVVTGGVETSKENLTSWFKSGVAGVGMGSKLITEKILADKDYNTLTNSAKDVLQIIQSLRN